MTKIESIHSWVEKNKIRKYSMICSKPRKRHLRQSNFSKGLTKLAILRDYKCPTMNCRVQNLLQSAKIGLSKWTFYVKNHPNLSGFFH